MAAAKKMAGVTKTGTRMEQLKNLALVLANQIDCCAQDVENGPKLLPQLARQYRETVREIDEMGGMGDADDEIGEILSSRRADGKPDAIR